MALRIEWGISLALAGGLTLAVAGTAGAAEKSLAEWKASFARPAGKPPHPTENPWSRAKEDLGRMLFFDPRLSGSNTIACATCHQPGLSWTDLHKTAIGEKQTVLPRRTPHLWNLAYGARLGWAGQFANVEAVTFGPLNNPGNMNKKPEVLAEELKAMPAYAERFKRAFPAEGVTPDTIAKALAVFERGMVSPEAPFDRWVRGSDNAISPAARRGFALFVGQARCVACHRGWNFTDDGFHDIGLPATQDLGRGGVLKTVSSVQYAFKTPSLRQVDRRRPYMHDGALPDLPAVLEHYVKGGEDRPSRSPDMRPVPLNAAERADLLAFLATLSGPESAVSVPMLPR